MTNTVIGISGLICCGKSTLAKALEEKGFLYIDCDKEAQKLLEKDYYVVHAMKANFGERIYEKDTGKIDKDVMASALFGDDRLENQGKLKYILEHPLKNLVHETRRTTDKPIVVESYDYAFLKTFTKKVYFVYTTDVNHIVHRINTNRSNKISQRTILYEQMNAFKPFEIDVRNTSNYRPMKFIANDFDNVDEFVGYATHVILEDLEIISQ